MAYWIDTGTGTPTDPGTTAVISAVRQYATEGGGGFQPTIPGPEWFNMITGEVLEVLAEAGISPDKASHTQLCDAIKKIVTNAAATQGEVNDSNPVDQINDKFITPKTLWGWVKQSTETVLGMMKVATQTQTNSGTADDVAVTPKKLRMGFAVLLGTNGYIALPTWMGGLLLQWGFAAGSTSGQATITLPIAFPNSILSLSGTKSAGFFTVIATKNGTNRSSFLLGSSNGASWAADNIFWFAIGY